MKTYEDFKLLEEMPDWVLVEEIAKTKQLIDDTVEAFHNLEMELEEESPFLVNSLKVETLTKQLHNLESYIGKAENILNEYEPSKHLTKILKRRNILFKDTVEPLELENSTNTQTEFVESPVVILNRRNKNIIKVG